jgi:hemerythrin-like domain-containing protein
LSDDALARFEEEHRVALAALERLEQAALALRSAEPAERHLAVVGDVLMLLQGAVREHNEAEERALFPLLGAEAPLGPFLEDHQALWDLEATLEIALRGGDRRRAADVALEIVDLLRSHILRENEVLFPMARVLLGPDGLAAVAHALDSGPG